MMNRIALSVMTAFALISTPVSQAKADDKVLASGACALAIAATALTACKFGASVNDARCRNSGLDQVRRACGQISQCKGDCKEIYKREKKKAKGIHKACKKKCNSKKRFRDRFSCKRKCGQAKKKTLKQKKSERNQCKKLCKTNYNNSACRKARAKLVAWATGMGASFAAIVKFCGETKR